MPVAAVGNWIRENLGLTIPAQQALAFRWNKNCPKHQALSNIKFLAAHTPCAVVRFFQTTDGTRRVPDTWFVTPGTIALTAMCSTANIILCSDSYKFTHWKPYPHRTGDPSSIDFKLHDFGFRGVSSVETAGVGAAAHLLSFQGTDTFAGIMLARDYYAKPMAGFSIPAAEHSTITAWGKGHEVDAMRNMLDQFPHGMVAVFRDGKLLRQWKFSDIRRRAKTPAE